MSRIGDPPHFYGAARLFQEWLVDKYGCIEAQRLHWIDKNQDKLRTDTYRGLADAVERGDHNVGSIGKRTTLPSSFPGGPRNMNEKYQDAMALTAKFGKPDIFITMTCNPYWKEIGQAHGPGQHAHDRPDLCARVFHVKKKALLTDVTKHMTFGKTVAHLHVIEFQKRGLPHAHILIFLSNEDKPRTPGEIDFMVSAQLPCERADPYLFKTVTRHMLHGPCGRGYNDKCVCINPDTKMCKKRYPKTFQDSTTIGDDSYPTYARPNNGRTVQRPHPTAGQGETILLDNRWVVLYNPYLLLKYDCHINVEICNSIPPSSTCTNTCTRAMTGRMLDSTAQMVWRLMLRGPPRINPGTRCRITWTGGTFRVGSGVPHLGAPNARDVPCGSASSTSSRR
jgi:hypothetical protein